MLFSAAFFYLFISFWVVFFSYHIQFLFFFSLNLEAAKLPIILLFLFFFSPTMSAIFGAFLGSRAPGSVGLMNIS